MIFPFPRIEIDPEVIMPNPSRFNNEQSFERHKLKGKFFRVYPTTPLEVKILAGLEHRVHKFAPYTEGGIIISAEAYKKHTGKGDK